MVTHVPQHSCGSEDSFQKSVLYSYVYMGPRGQAQIAEASFWFQTRSHVAKAGPEFLGSGIIDVHHLMQPRACVCVDGVIPGKGIVGAKALGPGYSVFRKGEGMGGGGGRAL